MTANEDFGGSITIGDITVRRMGYGAMRLTGDGIWGDFPDRSAGIEVLKRVVGLGVQFIDTADAYGPHTNESLIADALHPYSDVTIGTKGGLTRSGPNQWSPDGRPDHLRTACEGSLQRLRTDTIDVYQMHRPDPNVNYEDSIGTLAEMQKEGKIRHIGISNVDTTQLKTAQSIVDVVSVQNRYNLEDRESEDVLQACQAEGIAFLPWAPVASGSLASSNGPIQSVAKRHGATTAQVCLAWLLQHSPSIVLIPGTSSIQHLEENVGAVKLQLTPQDISELEGE